MGFVVGYAPCGLSPQIDGMPVIPKKELLLKRNSSKPRSESDFSSSLRIYFLFFLFLLST